MGLAGCPSFPQTQRLELVSISHPVIPFLVGSPKADRHIERESSCVFDLQSSPISQVSPSPLPLQLLSFRLPLLSSISRSVRSFQFFLVFESIIYYFSQLRTDFVRNDSGFWLFFLCCCCWENELWGLLVRLIWMFGGIGF